MIQMVSAPKKKTSPKLAPHYIVMGEWADAPSEKPFQIGIAKSLEEANSMAWDFMADWHSENVPVDTWIKVSYAPYQTTVGKRVRRKARK